MSDKNKFALSRRQLLGGLGAVGAASAGAGLGTTALFSDEESFENNSIAAGTLDLKVSWDEHYFNGIRNLDDVSSDNVEYGSSGSGETGFPTSSESPYLAVDDTAVDTFMDDTRTQEFPSGGLGQDEDPCEQLADVPGEDLPRPVIGLTDVKPGDFGEVTFDFALCNNAGYLWLTGNLIDEDENTVAEAETATPTSTATPSNGNSTSTATPTPTPPPDDGESFTISQNCDAGGVDENEDENEDEDEGGSGGDYTYTYVYDYTYEKGDFSYDYHYEYEWSEDAEQDPDPTAPPVDDSLACSEDGSDISPDPSPSPSPP